jgi:hypothetical protein
MCTLKELKDGTYSLFDVETMHQVIEIRSHLSAPVEVPDIPKY